MTYLIIFPIFLILSSNVNCALWINRKIYKYRFLSLDNGCRYFSPKQNEMRYIGITLTTLDIIYVINSLVKEEY